MDSPEFIFWIIPWKSYPGIGDVAINRSYLIKCVIGHQGIKTEESAASGKPPLKIPLDSIASCSYGILNDESTICEVELKLVDGHHLSVVPTNPFDPGLHLRDNWAETQAMAAVITALQDGSIPDYDINPYLRQLKKKPPKFLLAENETWDANTNPQVYYQKYKGDAEKVYTRVGNAIKYAAVLFFAGASLYILWQIPISLDTHFALRAYDFAQASSSI